MSKPLPPVTPLPPKAGDNPNPLARVNEVLVERVYRGEIDGGVLCSEGDARRLPLFRGCALGTPEEAARLFAWVEGGSWNEQRRATCAERLSGEEAPTPLTGLFEAPRSRLSLSGNLIGLAEAEVLFIGEGSEPTLILEQLTLALRSQRPWAIVFVFEKKGGAREWAREILLGVRDLIDDEIAKIQFWQLCWGADPGRALDEKFWPLALKKGKAAARRELLFIDAMMPVPSGRFFMDPSRNWRNPKYKVTISEGFWMSQTAVTQGLYALVMGENPARFEGETRPVESVSWYDAVRFCNRLSELAGLEPVYEIGEGDEESREASEQPPVSRREGADGFQLPTDAEWEHAARLGRELPTYEGAVRYDLSKLDEFAWHADNTGFGTHPVGQKRPTASALYGLSGNVYDWCFDRWDRDAYRGHEKGVTDPVSKAFWSADRAIRGGSWITQPHFCRPSIVGGQHPSQRFNRIGLRLIRRAR